MNIRLYLLAFFVVSHFHLCAYDFESNGIYYNLDAINKTVSVTSGNNKYQGDVIIPSTVTYSNQILPVTEIGTRAFLSCPSLESVEIPNSVTVIESYAFEYCRGLESIEIPNSVTKIKSSAFANCSSLRSIEIPNSITEIESSTFEGCTSLESVEIPNSITRIGLDAFEGCSSLMSIEIPNSVTVIERFAFYGCSSLESIEIPNSVTRIGDYAFSGCKSLKELIFEDGEDKLEFSFGDSPLEILYLGRNLEYKSYPFNDNTGFKTVSLGEYVTDATSLLYLSKSEGLETITCYNPIPPRIRDFTNLQYANVEVIVPVGALDAYKSANVWKNFWNLREAETSAIGDVLSDWTFDGGPVDVYDLSGRLVKRQASEDELQDLRPGIYIFRQGNTSKKILIQ